MAAHVVTVTPHAAGLYQVTSTSEGADNQPFDNTYDDRQLAEEVAHAIASTLKGLGRHARIVGCECHARHTVFA